MGEESTATGILRGVLGYCPNCGRGDLFSGFIRVRTPCPVCGIDNDMFPADDFPPISNNWYSSSYSCASHGMG